MTDQDLVVLFLENAPEKATTVYIRKGMPQENDLKIGQAHPKQEPGVVDELGTIWVAEADNFLTSCDGNFQLDSRV